MAIDGSINFDTSVDNTGLISGLEDIRQIFDGINGTISGLVSGMTDFVRETALAHNEISNLGDAIQDSTRHMPTERFSFLRDIILKLNPSMNRLADISGKAGNNFNGMKSALSGLGKIAGTIFSTKLLVDFGKVGNWFKDRWNDVTYVFSGVSDWFRDKFQSAYDGITDIFSSLSGFFSGIWENIDEGARNGVNWVIDKINGLVDAAENAVNFIIDCINSLSFDIPAFVPGIGGSHFGFDISYVNIPDIPHLAKGTVIPANYGEFLAVLGDNRKEREFVTPESALKNAMLEVISQMNNSQGQTVINVSMFPNERAFQQYIIKAGRNIQSRGGKIF